jgi:hypothetical protein
MAPLSLHAGAGCAAGPGNSRPNHESTRCLSHVDRTRFPSVDVSLSTPPGESTNDDKSEISYEFPCPARRTHRPPGGHARLFSRPSGHGLAVRLRQCPARPAYGRRHWRRAGLIKYPEATSRTLRRDPARHPADGVLSIVKGRRSPGSGRVSRAKPAESLANTAKNRSRRRLPARPRSTR